VIEASIDPERQFAIVQDAEGVCHAAVLCQRQTDSPYVVAMCDFFDAVDIARFNQDPNSFVTPERRWPADQEREGMMTCLRCIGS
jgi:hypothetical protein